MAATPLKGAKPVMLLLADALSPKGEWVGPYVQSVAAGVWVQAPESKKYLPTFDMYAPGQYRKLLDKKEYAA